MTLIISEEFIESSSDVLVFFFNIKAFRVICCKKDHTVRLTSLWQDEFAILNIFMRENKENKTHPTFTSMECMICVWCQNE
jgi:hypothetical protein